MRIKVKPDLLTLLLLSFYHEIDLCFAPVLSILFPDFHFHIPHQFSVYPFTGVIISTRIVTYIVIFDMNSGQFHFFFSRCRLKIFFGRLNWLHVKYFWQATLKSIWCKYTLSLVLQSVLFFFMENFSSCM